MDRIRRSGRATALALVAMMAFTLTPMMAAAQLAPISVQNTFTIPNAGTLQLPGLPAAPATVTVERFFAIGDQLFAVLNVTAGTATQTVVAPVQVAQVDPQRCDILELDIGAIHLDLLGLVVDIAPIHIDIFAVPGPGNLLGNLLCAIVGLLDPGPGNLTAVANLLNQILRILG
jgi:hypothetical protein